MADKQFNARIQLKYDTKEAFDAVANTYIPLAGEMIIARDDSATEVSGSTTDYIIKVGDGVTSWGALRRIEQYVQDDLQTNLNQLFALLSLKANRASPALTGTPTAPTATEGDNSTQIATTAFVNTAIENASSGGGGGTTIVVSETDPGDTLPLNGMWYKVIG